MGHLLQRLLAFLRRFLLPHTLARKSLRFLASLWSLIRTILRRLEKQRQTIHDDDAHLKTKPTPPILPAATLPEGRITIIRHNDMEPVTIMPSYLHESPEMGPYTFNAENPSQRSLHSPIPLRLNHLNPSHSSQHLPLPSPIDHGSSLYSRGTSAQASDVQIPSRVATPILGATPTFNRSLPQSITPLNHPRILPRIPECYERYDRNVIV